MCPLGGNGNDWCMSWWRHQMETFSALLVICAGNSTYKGQWRGALMFSLICVWINGWANSRGAGDLRRHRAHYDVAVIYNWLWQRLLYTNQANAYSSVYLFKNEILIHSMIHTEKTASHVMIFDVLKSSALAGISRVVETHTLLAWLLEQMRSLWCFGISYFEYS